MTRILQRHQPLARGYIGIYSTLEATALRVLRLKTFQKEIFGGSSSENISLVDPIHLHPVDGLHYSLVWSY